MKTMIIKRRILKGDKYIEQQEEVALMKERTTTVLVRLKSGDIIKRKKKDIVNEKTNRSKRAGNHKRGNRDR